MGNSKIICSTYYTGKPNPQKTAKEAIPNEYEMFKDWYESIIRLGCHGIIFHDHLLRRFIKRYKNDNIEFIGVPYYSDRESLNDERYYVYLKYLKEHPEVEWILTTDLFDVSFNKNPFEFICDKDKVYVGSETDDVANFPTIKWRAARSYGEIKDWWPTAEILLLNAGIIGGHRDVMLKFFQQMVDDFNAIEDKQLDSNMAVLSKVAIVDGFHIVTGPPLHSSYKKYEEKGNFYIRHK